MRELHRLQTDFQNYLLDNSTSIRTAIVDKEPVSATRRLNVYREAYYLRLLEALEQDYEVVRALMGYEEFDQIARDYIHQHPSTFRSIRWYGKEMFSFLQQKTNQLYLSEMAQFEWLLTESFDAADSNIFSVDEMATIPPKKWPSMRFILHPSLRLLNLWTNAVAIWQSYKENEILIPHQMADQPAPWIIWRKERDILFCSLTPAENNMLQTLIKGLSFKKLCERVGECVDEENVAMEAALFLKRLILDHLIIGIK